MNTPTTFHVVVTSADHVRVQKIAAQNQQVLSDLLRDYINTGLALAGHATLQPLRSRGRPGKVKLSRYDKVKIRELYQAGLSTEKIAEQFGCTSGATYWICRDLIRDSPQRQGRLRKKAARGG